MKKNSIKYFSEFFILAQINQQANPKWFNKTLKKLTQLKYKLFICTRNHPGNSDIKDQYRTVCLQLKKSLRQARLKYELNIISISKHNPKLIYSYVKGQRKLPSQIHSLIHPPRQHHYRLPGRVAVPSGIRCLPRQSHKNLNHTPQYTQGQFEPSKRCVSGNFRPMSQLQSPYTVKE
ncbi:hypothetical protein BpHYR1_023082 [Brachionus plicatilis]|uniref:RNA-directed DNA polymerase from mobile element jockey-like n=1 Tax=Brachionus plicatilis TaxID=10195 RepID=A0A3M7QW79_BRAPC|nr:hypothetical protein BpHYR1_023082 [Brachionus plicatilis]